MNAMQAYKNYSVADKAALQELRDHMVKQTGGEVKIADAIAAVEPGLETPEHLKKC